MKKALSLALVMAMTLSLAACGGGAKTTSTDKAAEPPAETKQEEPADKMAEEKAPAEEKTADAEAPADVKEYSYLMCWNGGAASWPDGWDKGSVAKEFEKKTGVHLNIETITSSETEKLALVFASGDVPDIINAPFWTTNPGGEGELIKNAGVEGLLLPLNQYLDKFPNIKNACTTGVAKPFVDLHLENPAFEGERYVIPRKAATDADVTNWAYDVFARKDILAKLNIEPSSVTTSDALYDLLKKIKDGGFTDVNGKPVIPAGNWHNGWSYQQYQLTWLPGGWTESWDKVGGKMTLKQMNPTEVDKTLFMRKLVSEGLYDAEAFNQTDTVGKEKMVTGRVATFGCHFPHMDEFFKSNLYKTNPEMEFVPLGPFITQNGTPVRTISPKGAKGFGCFILSSKVEDPERLLGLVEYASSEEGFLLSKFGIAGTHYTMENGVPTRTAEWTKIKTEDATKYNMEGFGMGELTTDDFMKSKGWDVWYNRPEYVHARDVRKLEFYDGYSADDIAEAWPDRAKYDEKMSTVNYDDELKKAISSASDEEAIAIIESYKKKMIAAGYEDMVKYIEEAMAKDPSIVY